MSLERIKTLMAQLREAIETPKETLMTEPTRMNDQVTDEAVEAEQPLSEKLLEWSSDIEDISALPWHPMTAIQIGGMIANTEAGNIQGLNLIMLSSSIQCMLALPHKLQAVFTFDAEGELLTAEEIKSAWVNFQAPRNTTHLAFFDSERGISSKAPWPNYIQTWIDDKVGG